MEFNSALIRNNNDIPTSFLQPIFPLQITSIRDKKVEKISNSNLSNFILITPKQKLLSFKLVNGLILKLNLNTLENKNKTLREIIIEKVILNLKKTTCEEKLKNLYLSLIDLLRNSFSLKKFDNTADFPDKNLIDLLWNQQFFLDIPIKNLSSISEDDLENLTKREPDPILILSLLLQPFKCLLETYFKEMNPYNKMGLKKPQSRADIKNQRGKVAKAERKLEVGFRVNSKETQKLLQDQNFAWDTYLKLCMNSQEVFLNKFALIRKSLVYLTERSFLSLNQKQIKIESLVRQFVGIQTYCDEAMPQIFKLLREFWSLQKKEEILMVQNQPRNEIENYMLPKSESEMMRVKVFEEIFGVVNNFLTEASVFLKSEHYLTSKSSAEELDESFAFQSLQISAQESEFKSEDHDFFYRKRKKNKKNTKTKCKLSPLRVSAESERKELNKKGPVSTLEAGVFPTSATENSQKKLKNLTKISRSAKNKRHRQNKKDFSSLLIQQGYEILTSSFSNSFTDCLFTEDNCLEEVKNKELLELNQNYMVYFKGALRKKIDQKLSQGNLNYDLSFFAVSAMQEVETHSNYSMVALETLLQAFENKNWLSIRQIVPMCLLDLFIQTEQSLRTAFIFHRESMNSTHSLVQCCVDLDIMSSLSTKEEGYIHAMDMATIWIRYPGTQLNYYSLREKIEVPSVLKLIHSCQNYDPQQDKNFCKLREIVKTLFSLYVEQDTIREKILKKIEGLESSKKPESLDVLLIEEINRLKSAIMVLIPVSNHYEIAKTSTHASNSAIGNLADCSKRLSVLTRNLNLLISRNKEEKLLIPNLKIIKSFVNNAQTLTERLIENFHLAMDNDDPAAFALLYRNQFCIQFVLEALYTVSWMLRGQLISKNPQIISHDLVKQHECMKDSEEMNPKAYSFIKSMQYRGHSHFLSDTACAKVNLLEKFEKLMHIEENEENEESIEAFLTPFNDFINESTGILSKHITRCENDFTIFSTGFPA